MRKKILVLAVAGIGIGVSSYSMAEETFYYRYLISDSSNNTSIEPPTDGTVDNPTDGTVDEPTDGTVDEDEDKPLPWYAIEADPEYACGAKPDYENYYTNFTDSGIELCIIDPYGDDIDYLVIPPEKEIDVPPNIGEDFDNGICATDFYYQTYEFDNVVYNSCVFNGEITEVGSEPVKDENKNDIIDPSLNNLVLIPEITTTIDSIPDNLSYILGSASLNYKIDIEGPDVSSDFYQNFGKIGYSMFDLSLESNGDQITTSFNRENINFGDDEYNTYYILDDDIDITSI